MSQPNPRKVWNFTPALPLKIAPFWDWPMKPVQSIIHLLKSWKPLKERAVFLVVAIAIWLWATPEMERMATIHYSWILEIWVRNLIIISVTAGGLHLYLHTFSKQGDELRYDKRPLLKKAKVFTFGSQTKDNMFWSLTSGVTVWTAWETLMMWCFANGYLTMITFAESPIWFVCLMLLIPIWAGLHFFVQHRILHIGPLFRWFHSWHHKNQNTGPWSGLAMHPVEHIILFSDNLLYFLVACHPIHLYFNFMLHGMGAPTSHVGYHGVKLGEKNAFLLGDFYHQLHHRFFDCNYGDGDTPWDKWFGTFHDGTAESDERIRERRRQIWHGKA